MTSSSASAPQADDPHLVGITIDCHDPKRLADFWHGLLGGVVDVPLPGWLRVVPSAQGPVLTFQPVPEPKIGKARLHLDIGVADIDAAMQRVIDLGGNSGNERHDYDEGVVVVMGDTEGNEFCLVQYFSAPSAE